MSAETLNLSTELYHYLEKHSLNDYLLRDERITLSIVNFIKGKMDDMVPMTEQHNNRRVNT